MENTDDSEKWLWTEADFETMNWHGSRVHAVAFAPEESEIIFDIHYIFEWIRPVQEGGNFSFRVAPATLVFENVWNIEFDLNCFNGGLEIDSIDRELKGAPHNAEIIGKGCEWAWTIKCQEGEISFRAVGFQMFTRAPQLRGRRAWQEKFRSSAARLRRFERAATALQTL